MDLKIRKKKFSKKGGLEGRRNTMHFFTRSREKIIFIDVDETK